MRETRGRRRCRRQARRPRAVAALESVAQLPKLRNGAPPLVPVQGSCAEIVIKTSQPGGTIQEASDTAVEMNQIEQSPVPGDRAHPAEILEVDETQPRRRAVALLHHQVGL